VTHAPFNETEIMMAEIQAQERETFFSPPRIQKLSPGGRRLEVPDTVPLRLDCPVYRITTVDCGTLWMGQRRITDQLSPLYSLYTRHGDEVFRAALLCLVKAYVRRTF